MHYYKLFIYMHCVYKNALHSRCLLIRILKDHEKKIQTIRSSNYQFLKKKILSLKKKYFSKSRKLLFSTIQILLNMLI